MIGHNLTRWMLMLERKPKLFKNVPQNTLIWTLELFLEMALSISSAVTCS